MNRLRRLVLGATVAPGGGSVIHGSVGRNLLK